MNIKYSLRGKLQNYKIIKILNEIKKKKILKKDKVIAIIPAERGSKRFKMKILQRFGVNQ